MFNRTATTVGRGRRRRVGALAISAVLAGSIGASAVSAQSPEAISGDVSFMSWDLADLTAGLGLGYETARHSFTAQNPGTTVTYDVVPFADFVATATTRARAGELSDVVQMLPGLNHAPVFDALTPSTPADWGDLGTDLSGWQAGVIDPADPNTVAGVPIGGQGVVFYYNKALFEQAGLDPETPPTTWAEFTAAADALKAADITPMASSGVDSFLPWWVWSAYSPQYFTPEEVLQIRSGEIPLTDPRVLASLQPVAEMAAAGYWNEDHAERTWSDMETAFANGEVAMIPGIVSAIVNWKTWDGSSLGPDGYGVFGAPLRDDATSDGQFFNPTLIFGVNAASENPEAAKAWVEFLAGTEGQTILLTQAGQFPNRGDVDLEQYASAGAKAIQGIIDSRGASDVIQNQFSAAAQGEALQKLTSAAVSGDLETFLADLQAQQGS